MVKILLTDTQIVEDLTQSIAVQIFLGKHFFMGDFERLEQGLALLVHIFEGSLA